MADSGSGGSNLAAAWLGFGRSVAVASAAAFALLSLLFHVPVWVAALRGGLLFVGLWTVVRTTLWFATALRADAQQKRAAGGKS